MGESLIFLFFFSEKTAVKMSNNLLAHFLMTHYDVGE